MARAKTLRAKPQSHESQGRPSAAFDEAAPIAGVQGSGKWLVAQYYPTAPFSLKISLATSSVGKSLVVATPYAIKMAFVDAAFRAGLPDDQCSLLLRSLVGVTVRIAPPAAAVVTHTFLKVRQESRDSDPLRPYIATISYREIVHHHGMWRWAFDLTQGDESMAGRLAMVAPYVSYIGKRGSFVQFHGLCRLGELGSEFTQPVQNEGPWVRPCKAHIVPLGRFRSRSRYGDSEFVLGGQAETRETSLFCPDDHSARNDE
jgi:hypothetical protein